MEAACSVSFHCGERFHLQVDVGLARHVNKHLLDRPVRECPRVVPGVVRCHRSTCTATDLETFAGNGERSELRPDLLLRDLYAVEITSQSR
jgi:hypothetical protein